MTETITLLPRTQGGEEREIYRRGGLAYIFEDFLDLSISDILFLRLRVDRNQEECVIVKHESDDPKSSSLTCWDRAIFQSEFI
jgi:hypothetical protein